MERTVYFLCDVAGGDNQVKKRVLDFVDILLICCKVCTEKLKIGINAGNITQFKSSDYVFFELVCVIRSRVVPICTITAEENTT